MEEIPGEVELLRMFLLHVECKNQVLNDKYTDKFINLRKNYIETFHSIGSTLNPITRSTRQVKAAPPLPMSGGFRLNADLKPPTLMREELRCNQIWVV